MLRWLPYNNEEERAIRWAGLCNCWCDGGKSDLLILGIGARMGVFAGDSKTAMVGLLCAASVGAVAAVATGAFSASRIKKLF